MEWTGWELWMYHMDGYIVSFLSFVLTFLHLHQMKRKSLPLHYLLSIYCRKVDSKPG